MEVIKHNATEKNTKLKSVNNNQSNIAIEFDIDDIRKWHTDPRPKGNGWSDVGYHYVVLLNLHKQ